MARDGYIESTNVFCPSKILSHGNKNTLSLVMVCSALFNNVFKAFTLFFKKYVTLIQLLAATKFYTEFSSQIHEGSISLRFLSTILRVLRLEVSEWNSLTIGKGVRFSSFLLCSV